MDQFSDQTIDDMGIDYIRNTKAGLIASCSMMDLIQMIRKQLTRTACSGPMIEMKLRTLEALVKTFNTSPSFIIQFTNQIELPNINKILLRQINM